MTLTNSIFSIPIILFSLWLIALASLFLYRPDHLVVVKAGILRWVPLGKAEFDLRDFGGVGNGEFDNTNAFTMAVKAIERRGGGRLNVSAGFWLTSPFNLTSNMTLFLDHDAVILGIKDEHRWPLMPPLPSYGYGRDHKGPRYGSLIHGQNLTNVLITGNNGTIDGQGQAWWTKYRRRILNHTRGPLVQIMWSRNIIVSNITLRNSPFWTLHPYDCKNVTVSNVTILSPDINAPNTDGINPDSCDGVLIENCYISVGDDAIAIKSGWDQYGIKYNQPSTNILIRNLIVHSVVSAGVSIGSEMSGGVSNIRVENVHVWNSRRALRIKTTPGRGSYVRNIAYHNITITNTRVAIVIMTYYNEHADDDFDRFAMPKIENVTYDGIYGYNVRVPVKIQGTDDIPIVGVDFKNVYVQAQRKKKHLFQCASVSGRVYGNVYPAPCKNLDLYDDNGRLMEKSILYNATDVDYDL